MHFLPENVWFDNLLGKDSWQGTKHVESIPAISVETRLEAMLWSCYLPRQAWPILSAPSLTAWGELNNLLE